MPSPQLLLRLRAAVLALALLAHPLAPAQEPVISEFLAANASGLLDADGEASDWIEIFNPSPAAMSMAGWSLTDDAADLAKWSFPAVTIPGNAFLTVFASGKDRRDPAAELHTNFALARDGEYLALVRPDGSPASEFAPSYPPQFGDVSYGPRVEITEQILLAGDASAAYRAPVDGSDDGDWMLPAFVDASWPTGSMGIGYDEGDPMGGGTVVDDITAAGDLIVPTSFNSPGGEEVDKAIDGTSTTKYLNFDTLDAGFTVTPSAGAGVVTGLRLTSANDAAERDPTSFTLSGSNDGSNFTAIAAGAIPNFPSRFATVAVDFDNSAAYLHYRLLFPTVRNAGAAVAMQIAEVEFPGRIGAPAANFADLIGTELAGDIDAVYLRASFALAAAELPATPTLKIWYDDGFIAYLNGVEVARANAPASPSWNSSATADRAREAAVAAERFDLTPFAALFVEGANLLAVHALNDAADSPEFLLRTELADTAVNIGSDAFFATPTPGSANLDAFDGIVANPVASVARGFFAAPFALALSTATEGATIRYTTDGSQPGAGSGSLYTGPLNIATTTVLRAAAFRDGWQPSQTVTHSYLFPSDVVGQTQQSALAAGLPATWNGQAADYGLDSRVPVQAVELTTLPSISLAIDVDEMFGSSGIYANPNARGAAWERAVSFEWLDPAAGNESFQEGAGLRIQGGAFRRFDLTLKKSFRLIFREQYGAPRLRHSIFGPDAAAEADSIVLRANGNDAWKWGGSDTLYIRDAFAMGSMRAMGNVASHSSFAHLYINGHYWGLYNPAERPDAAFSSIYHGGNDMDWDALNQDSVPDGNADAWNRLLAQLATGLADDANYQRIQGNNPDGTRNADYEVLLDVDNMIDYMILNFYIGNQDWPHRNHWYGINREGDQGFQFYPWDSETAMGLGSGLSTNRLGVTESVARPFVAARANAEFRVRFGDRVQRHFFNNGSFHVDPAAPGDGEPAKRFRAIADSVEAAIAGESARWGDQLNTTPFTREGHWRPERDSLLNSYFPQRSAVVLGQFRAAGLYPNTDAPVFNQQGGQVDQGFAMTLSAGAASILYTLDGSDPRAPGTVEELNLVELVDEGAARRVLVPGSAVDPGWRSDPAWDDSTWLAGAGAVGYDANADFRALIDIDIEAELRGVNGSALIRVPFDYAPDPEASANFMTLRARFDDGFIAYLNGQEIASANAPAAPLWNSVATTTNDDAAAVQWRDFDVADHIDALLPGANLLAVHALNVTTASSDFLFDAELELGERRVDGGDALVYSGPVVLDDLTTVRARALDGGEWSALVEATFVVGFPRLTVSELDYHPGAPSAGELAAGFSNSDDFEFIEFFNPTSLTFDLRGVRFADGVEFEFADSPIASIPGGGRIVLVSNAEAFAQRYGSAAIVAGEYSGQFSNAGEHVEIVGADGTTLIDFTYGDAPPWPTAADGRGSSLELRDPAADPAQAGAWSASVSDPTPGDRPAPRVAREFGVAADGGDLLISFLADPGASYLVQTSADLASGWQLFQTVAVELGGSVEVRIPIDIESGGGFYRVVTE